MIILKKKTKTKIAELIYERRTVLCNMVTHTCTIFYDYSRNNNYYERRIK
jgi:hypothetical protein